jgi:hypothetical protein
VRLANYLYNVAPRDGTALGATSRSVAFEPMLGNKAAQYEPDKFTWIGSANDEVGVCVSWYTTGIARFEDLLVKEMTVGSTGFGDDTYQFPRFVNNVLGTKMKIIPGYPGGNDDQLRHGARRGRRTLRLVVVEHQADPHVVGDREEDQSADAVLAF